MRASPPSLARALLAGYDRRSLVALTLLVSLGAAVGYRWSDLVDAEGVLDLLLLGIWVWMAAAIVWNVSPRTDLTLVLVGASGGGIIEWWGTNTQLWTYFTNERPPLWILPAWPVAALTIERMRSLLDRLVTEVARPSSERWFLGAYYACVPAFVVTMSVFLWPTHDLTASRVVLVWMVWVGLRCPAPRRDMLLFVAGSLLGVFLEYWGTSRECWTYYTREVPPPVTILAHGFASVAFARVQETLRLAAERVLGACQAIGLLSGGSARG